ncbi:hypothetical protein CALVIDRAFT_540799 [Calocera viscosa TUFC12733]|uniref:F-box domain-containing protein n=1 Tax=Calocera viscosa (strain TUFC12733) TaxID=1330018 RepID=A0A167IK49_CALVF|nr:hypothetical protein CALVIDRAFT_540799 [Calocera viscosa TUFC12733]
MPNSATQVAQLQHALDAGNRFKTALHAIDIRRPLHDDHQHDPDTVNDAVNRLQNDLKVLMQQINETRNALLSPLYRLHDDLLQEIFLMCTVAQPWRYIMQPEEVAQDTVDPLVITWICRRWRDIALRSPVIWTNVTLGPTTWPRALLVKNPWHPGVLGEEKQRVQNWSRNQIFLERSKKTPLHITLLACRPPIMEKIRDLFLKENEGRPGPRFLRITDSHLSHSEWTDATSLMLRCLEAVRDTVEYLSLGSNYQSENFDTFARSIVCASASNLHGLRLNGFHLPTKLVPKSEYLNCRFLSLDRMTATSALMLLSACPRLQHLVFRASSQQLFQEFDLDVVELPCLRECFLLGKGIDFSRLLPAIRAPQLHTLKCQLKLWTRQIEDEERRQEYQQLSRTLTSFASSSGCSLHALSLTHIPLDFLPETLAALPSLKSFQYVEDDYYGESYSTLLPEMTARVLCPQLEEIIRHGYCSVKNMMKLERFIRERNTHNTENSLSPIRRLRLSYDELQGGPPLFHLPDERRSAKLQKGLAQLLDEIVIGKVGLDKSTMDWVPSSGGGNWLQTWDDYEVTRFLAEFRSWQSRFHY